MNIYSIHSPNMSVCEFMCDCLFVCEHISETTCLTFIKFLCMLPVAVAQFSRKLHGGKIAWYDSLDRSLVSSNL